jgi:hypothetical protein
MRAPPSQADNELTEEVRNHGASWVKASQVQAWHEYGVFSSSQRWLGQGKGSVSSYPPGTAELVARFARLVRLFRSVDAGVIWLFLEDSPLGERIGERGLKRALISLCAGLPEPSSTKAPAIQAAQMGVKAAWARSAKDRVLAKSLGVREPENRENVYRDLAAATLGQPAAVDPSRGRSTPMLVKALHLEDQYADDPQHVAGVLNKRMGTGTRTSLERLVKSATGDDLQRARIAAEPLIPMDVIEQIKPGLRKSYADLVAGALLSRLQDQVFEREAVRAKT